MYKAKILIVEDEFVVALDIRRFLEQNGYNVVEIADTGKDALKKIDQLDPDLILMDVVLRGEMDGIDVAKKIKEDFSIPLIYITAHPEKSMINRAKFTAPYGYLLKPFKEKELLNTIELALTKHEMEIKLKRIEEKQLLADIIEFLPDATFAIDRDGKVIAWNRAVEEMTGTPKEDILGKGDYAYAIPWYGERRPILIDLIGNKNSEFSKKYDYIHEKGQTLYAEVYVPQINQGKGAYLWATASPLLDSAGRQYGAIESVRDINDLKRAEKGLEESEEKFKLVVESAAEGISILDKEGRILDVNQKLLDLTGFEREEVLGKNFLELLPQIKIDVKNVLSKFQDAITSKGPQSKEITMINRQGEKVSIIAYLNVLRKDEEIMGMSFILEDITERKNYENKIKAALEEKELLLKEIHHRVKNNLQIITSLLVVQREYVDDDSTSDVLNECKNRVISMAMIHEMLYQSKDLSQINFSNYINKLVSNLYHSYNPQGKIKPVIKVSDVFMTIDIAVPCGLIISELVSNSLKYAFPHQATGEILVSLKYFKGEYELIISDNGVGIPEDLDFTSISSFGLRLVNLLIEQLDGTIELDRNQGTKFTIKFKEPKYKKRI